MELNFLGRGSAFNTKEGNTSAYFIDNNNLFLIDSGETVFSKLTNTNLLNKTDNINVLITHTHPDHIGSLGSLIFYAYYNLKKKINIILPHNAKYLDSIKNILSCMGCNENQYNFIEENNFDKKFNKFNTIRFIETVHTNELNCYSILFNTNSGIVFYSGDTCETKNLENIINSKEKINKIYIEVSSIDYPGNVHIYIDKLNNIIPKYLKNKTYCMHINDDKCIQLATKYGFNIVDVIK